MSFRWDTRFAHTFGICHFAPENGGAGGGDGGSGDGGDGSGGDSGAGDGGAGSGGGAGGDTTDWKAEAEKWKGLSRKHEAASKIGAEAVKKLEEIENASKTELQKAQDAQAAAAKEAATAKVELMRARVALKKGLTEAQAKRLQGDDEAAMEADADELLESFKGGETDKGSSSRTPRERLRPGSSPNNEAEETDPAKLAALVPRSPF